MLYECQIYFSNIFQHHFCELILGMVLIIYKKNMLSFFQDLISVTTHTFKYYLIATQTFKYFLITSHTFNYNAFNYNSHIFQVTIRKVSLFVMTFSLFIDLKLQIDFGKKMMYKKLKTTRSSYLQVNVIQKAIHTFKIFFQVLQKNSVNSFSLVSLQRNIHFTQNFSLCC